MLNIIKIQRQHLAKWGRHSWVDLVASRLSPKHNIYTFLDLNSSIDILFVIWLYWPRTPTPTIHFQYKILPMTGFELWTPSAQSTCSANWAKTTQSLPNLALFEQILSLKKIFHDVVVDDAINLSDPFRVLKPHRWHRHRHNFQLSFLHSHNSKVRERDKEIFSKACAYHFLDLKNA